ncbi:hypothetical protein NE865_09778 [Phthorimaea operculella]|nr:hypothetical protein NE865_09778 [Phthorimaea operculella]
MGEVSFEVSAYAKIILHAAKYPHSAVNGILLADASSIRDGAKNQSLDIVDCVPLFHHSHNLSPMAEVALTQIEAVAQADNRIIAGYYAACENFRDNTVEKCPGLKIAEKIVDNKRMAQNLDSPAIKIHKYSESKWKPMDGNKVLFQTYLLETVSHLLQRGVQKDLIDFDNYLDDVTQDWTNLGIEKLVASINASNSIDCKG